MAAHAGKYAEELIRNARQIATPGKGILAADESTTTIGKRFVNICVDNTEANRQAYRELLFTTREALPFLSGAILFEETLFQKTLSGKPFVEVLKEAGVYTGIKVDIGVVELPGTRGETATQGLDGLAERCQRYYAAGARFAKWRAVLKIGPEEPSEQAMQENAHGLARYAVICQENGLVPIVEPEVLADGNHDIKKCAAVTERVLATVYKALSDHKVLLEGTLLKPNMVTPGAGGPKATPEQIAGYTLQCLQRTVPVAVPGVMFLSGGQSEEEATVNLNAINAMNAVKPWVLSFSYGRALQHTALRIWGGRRENVPEAQRVFASICQANSNASMGNYQGCSNSPMGSSENLHIANYKY
ncbi:hypothetical protein GOP47_0003888 [Adiantum capillus-veneris]|uniref:Fructose-bisphosphate aldolase n=1 Tax=Adiantum capillus-veneris TaxID=13818 RepID=A0A9D4V753_ADICA|nr:hypothetical protein GOP47_0003888 [Adiantum capillus-veneris]